MSTFADRTGGMGRRRFLAAAAATGGAAAFGLLGSTAARATTQPGLPPVGAEIPCSMLSPNTPLRIRTALVSADFKGGIKVRAEVNPDDPGNSVRLRTIGFRMSAELSDSGQDGGTITVEQDDVDVTPRSLLRLTNQYPPRYEHLMVLGLTMTIDRPGGARTPEPLVLTTKDPAALIGKLTQFPPRGDVYRLQNPVDLVLPDDPDTTIATIERFPVKVAGL